MKSISSRRHITLLHHQHCSRMQRRAMSPPSGLRALLQLLDFSARAMLAAAACSRRRLVLRSDSARRIPLHHIMCTWSLSVEGSPWPPRHARRLRRWRAAPQSAYTRQRCEVRWNGWSAKYQLAFQLLANPGNAVNFRVRVIVHVKASVCVATNGITRLVRTT